MAVGWCFRKKELTTRWTFGGLELGINARDTNTPYVHLTMADVDDTTKRAESRAHSGEAMVN